MARGAPFVVANESRPAGARGLKRAEPDPRDPYHNVAPRRGAWIETIDFAEIDIRAVGRAPQGRVD